MSGRHGYIEDLDQADAAMWRGRVLSAIRGRRGQKLLTDLLAALEAMPEKRLVSRKLQTADGEVCSLGCLAKARGVSFDEPGDGDYCDWEDLNHELAATFDVAECLVREIEYENDEAIWDSSAPDAGEKRHRHMVAWIKRHLKAPTP